MGCPCSKVHRPEDMLSPLTFEDCHGVDTDSCCYETIHDVEKSIRRAGLDSSNLIIGIDFSRNNQCAGMHTFQGKCLHDIDISSETLNPYQQILTTLGRVLEGFDDDYNIPVFGFGDERTKGDGCFSLKQGGCNGFGEVISEYITTAGEVKLSGPINYAPMLREAMKEVEKTGSYHIIVIITSGETAMEQETIQAISAASHLPISIIVIGLGDGPWDSMSEFESLLEDRQFANFHFVDFEAVKKKSADNLEVEFAIRVLHKVPEQYRDIRELGLLRKEA